MDIQSAISQVSAGNDLSKEDMSKIILEVLEGKVTDAQMQSVDNNLMRESDPRMSMFNNRKSEVTFGKG